MYNEYPDLIYEGYNVINKNQVILYESLKDKINNMIQNQEESMLNKYNPTSNIIIDFNSIKRFINSDCKNLKIVFDKYMTINKNFLNSDGSSKYSLSDEKMKKKATQELNEFETFLNQKEINRNEYFKEGTMKLTMEVYKNAFDILELIKNKKIDHECVTYISEIEKRFLKDPDNADIFQIMVNIATSETGSFMFKYYNFLFDIVKICNNIINMINSYKIKKIQPIYTVQDIEKIN